MCAVGLRIAGELIKKPEEFWASCEDLVAPLRGLRCNGKHRHGQLAGSYQGVNKTRLAQVWPWELATRIASAIAHVVRQHLTARRFGAKHGKTVAHHSARTNYAILAMNNHTADSSTAQQNLEYWQNKGATLTTFLCEDIGAYVGGDHLFPPPGERSRNNRLHWPCPACRANLSSTDVRHTRHPEDCRWPDVEADTWSCPGCVKHLPRGHVSHTS